MTKKSSFSREELLAEASSVNSGQKAEMPPNRQPTGPAPELEASRGEAQPAINLKVRSEIADKLEDEMHGTTIEWISECKGVCQCPNKDQHSGSNRSECVIWIDGDFDPKESDQWPTKKCSHNHCQDHPIIKQFNHELRSRIAKAEHREDNSTPNAYLKSVYPKLAEKYGDPFECKWIKKGDSPAICTPVALNENFFAALLVREGNAKNPGVFDLDENKWLRYGSNGYYDHVKPEAFHADLAALMLDVARKCGSPIIDTKPLQFRFRSTKFLSPIVTKAVGMACVNSTFWQWPTMKIPVANGVLDIGTRTLEPHSPDFHFRGVLGVVYAPGGQCTRWLKFLERLPEDDRDFLRRFFGQVLTGKNLAQKFVILLGTPASGKGAIARVLTGLAGPGNVGKLRTEQLAGRFETGRLRNKTLIYAGDVPQDFLNNKGARILKEITGGDPDTPEYKGSNATPPAIPIDGSVMVTCNSRLRIRFESDKEAWQRRLVLILFEGAGVPEDDQKPDFSERLLAEEGSGILNWALEGRDKLAADGFKLRMSERQKQVRDALLEESESWTLFARECVQRSEGDGLGAKESYENYVPWCHSRGWTPATEQVFGTGFNRALQELYGVTRSNDLGVSRSQRGWHNLALRNGAEPLVWDYKSQRRQYRRAPMIDD